MNITIKANQSKYFKCSMYYLRRYFGLREIIVLGLLLGISITLYLVSDFYIMFILFGICVFLIIVAAILFLITSKAGYKVDVAKYDITEYNLDFREFELVVTSYDSNGKAIYEETHPYDRLDRISIKPNRIYIYALVSVFYYITLDDVTPEKMNELVEFLNEKIPVEKFKFKGRYRKYPKKQKITLDPNNEYSKDEKKSKNK